MQKYFFLSWAFLIWVSAGVQADERLLITLPERTFENQWNLPVHLDKTVRWIIFTKSKKASHLVKEALFELNKFDFVRYHLLYVADISGMPGWIARYIAIPKMQEYAFPIALVKDLHLVEHWPVESDQVSVFRVSHLQIIQRKTFENKLRFVLFMKQHCFVDRN